MGRGTATPSLSSWASGELASGHDGKRRKWIQQSRGRSLVDVVSLVSDSIGIMAWLCEKCLVKHMFGHLAVTLEFLENLSSVRIITFLLH